MVKGKNFEFRAAFGGELSVLIESQKDGYFVGYDQHFNKIMIESDEDLIGNWVNINKYEVKEESNYARV
jgi:hypothetical protein